MLRKNRPAEAVEKLKTATELMRDEPRAFNLLGVAYHQAGQPQLAAQAYRQALAKDKSNLVAVAHYNFGCLLLEQNNAAGAVDELRSYTLSTNSFAGWMRLASAQLRLRQFQAAETSLGAAARLEPRNPELLNTLGVLHAQRGQRDAGQFFASALQASPKYSPALLNAGLLLQQNQATKPAALQRFKEFIARHPEGTHASYVRAAVQQLESELAPSRPALTNIAALPATATKSNSVPVIAAAAAATNPNPATAGAPRMATVPKTNAGPIVPKTNLLAAATKTAPSNAPAAPVTIPVKVVQVTNDSSPVIAAAAPIVTGTSPASAPATTSPPKPPADMKPTEAAAEQTKPGFFSRLNPFRGKTPTGTNGEATQTVAVNAATSAGDAARPVFPRYSYTLKHAPAAGNRAEAERVMQKAVQAQRSGNTNEALLDYQLAVNADPGFFDAQYNGALLAYLSGDLKRALAGYEAALTIEPASINARYNFALALKQGGYAHDAMLELERILEAKPAETRAHLTLANLCAQQLEDNDRARLHYVKVLEQEPRHPQAAAIRFWLAAHP